MVATNVLQLNRRGALTRGGSVRKAPAVSPNLDERSCHFAGQAVHLGMGSVFRGICVCWRHAQPAGPISAPCDPSGTVDRLGFCRLDDLGCLQAASHSNTNLAAYAPTRSLRFGPHAFLATIGGRFSVSTHLIQGANPSCQRRQQDFRF